LPGQKTFSRFVNQSLYQRGPNLKSEEDAMRIAGRLTHYRSVVLEMLREANTHPTAAELFRIVRKRRPGVAYATIYNSLNWLEQKGMIARVDFADEAARYDPIIERHDHLICNHCGALRDVTIKLPGRILAHVARGIGFRVERYRTEFFGLCGKCARTNGAKPRNGNGHSQAGRFAVPA
jgi:Fur family ferric uptake transcriptional regulator/Fur family peroxide stress response transcriptional regulator